MKLSDVTGERTFDVIADIIEPIANIAQDPKAAAVFEPAAVPDGMTNKEFFVQRMRDGMPGLLKDHKADVIAILAAIDGSEPEEYASSLNLMKLTKDVLELMSDEVFVSFLA